jgi:hypothetical protein
MRSGGVLLSHASEKQSATAEGSALVESAKYRSTTARADIPCDEHAPRRGTITGAPSDGRATAEGDASGTPGDVADGTCPVTQPGKAVAMSRTVLSR